MFSAVKKQAILVVDKKKAELTEWIAKCNEGSAKLQKINEQIVAHSRKLQDWVKLVKSLGKCFMPLRSFSVFRMIEEFFKGIESNEFRS